jgi:hypothetical protein
LLVDLAHKFGFWLIMSALRLISVVAVKTALHKEFSAATRSWVREHILSECVCQCFDVFPALQDCEGAAAAGEGGGSSSSLEASLSAAATRVKQKGAEEFVERLSAALAGKEAAAQVQIDPLLAQAGGCDLWAVWGRAACVRCSECICV